MFVEVERSLCIAKGFFSLFLRCSCAGPRGAAAWGPSGLPSPPGTWDLQFRIRFLEMPGQHHCLPQPCLCGGGQ